MSAVHKRLHYAMRQEFKILARVMSETLPAEYPYTVEGADQSVMASDFDDRVDVIPVSIRMLSVSLSGFCWLRRSCS